jgi:hypothetical protein
MRKHILVSLFLESEGIPYTVILGTEVLELSRGKILSNDGLVKPILYPEYLLQDIYQAVEFVNKRGLRRC